MTVEEDSIPSLYSHPPLDRTKARISGVRVKICSHDIIVDCVRVKSSLQKNLVRRLTSFTIGKKSDGVARGRIMTGSGNQYRKIVKCVQ